MGDFGKVMEDQFLSLLAYVAEQERGKISNDKQKVLRLLWLRV